MAKNKTTTTEAPKTPTATATAVPAPEAEKPTPATATAVPALSIPADTSLRAAVKLVVEKIGASADLDSVKDVLSAAGRKDGSESSLTQYIRFAMQELGHKTARSDTGNGTATRRQSATVSDEPTITDLTNAKKLAGELGMTIPDLSRLVEKLATGGDLNKLRKCLDFWKTNG